MEIRDPHPSHHRCAPLEHQSIIPIKVTFLLMGGGVQFDDLAFSLLAIVARTVMVLCQMPWDIYGCGS